MSFISEVRRKEKWSLNPCGNLWCKDENKFGQRMLENMGWSKGKGLGKNEDGDPNCIRVSVKNDTKGMGYQGYDNTWLEHQEGFDELLKKLNGVQELEGNDAHIKNLEIRSSKTKARVQYNKFIRGKDLSKKSSKDLQCLFGKKEKNDKNIDGANTVYSGSMDDYFKQKLATINKNIGGLTNTKSSNNSEDSQAVLNDFECSLILDSDNVQNERKTKQKKRKPYAIEENNLLEEFRSVGERFPKNSCEEGQEYKSKVKPKKRNKMMKYDNEQSDVSKEDSERGIRKQKKLESKTEADLFKKKRKVVEAFSYSEKDVLIGNSTNRVDDELKSAKLKKKKKRNQSIANNECLE